MPKHIIGWYESKSGYWYHPAHYGIVHVKAVCDECRQEFFERKYKARSAKGGKGNHFCSHRCAKKATVREQDLSHLKQFEFKKGQVPHNFNGRTKHSAGYWVRSGGKRRALEHRVLVEQMLGRPLKRSEVIHHVNGDVSDNRLENLRIMSQSEHAKLHWKEGAYDERNKK